jgi:hypothetical protein
VGVGEHSRLDALTVIDSLEAGGGIVVALHVAMQAVGERAIRLCFCRMLGRDRSCVAHQKRRFVAVAGRSVAVGGTVCSYVAPLELAGKGAATSG